MQDIKGLLKKFEKPVRAIMEANEDTMPIFIEKVAIAEKLGMEILPGSLEWFAVEKLIGFGLELFDADKHIIVSRAYSYRDDGSYGICDGCNVDDDEDADEYQFENIETFINARKKHIDGLVEANKTIALLGFQLATSSDLHTFKRYTAKHSVQDLLDAIDKVKENLTKTLPKIASIMSAIKPDVESALEGATTNENEDICEITGDLVNGILGTYELDLNALDEMEADLDIDCFTNQHIASAILLNFKMQNRKIRPRRKKRK
jgi:hypothetical protein